MDARGKFGEHEGSVRVARGDSGEQLSFPRRVNRSMHLQISSIILPGFWIQSKMIFFYPFNVVD